MSVIKKQSLKQNFIFQILYQVSIFVIPLFVSPYLTRKLGDTSLGIYSYTNSIVGYFILIANLGIARYGQRVIASRKNNLEKLRKTFWSLYTTHIIFSIFTLFIYIVFIYCFVKEYKYIYIIQIIYLLSALFDITWLFQGLENFKSVVIRNASIKILECIFIFIFIKNSTDLLLYTTIMSISICLSQIIMIPQAIYQIKPIKFCINDIKEHIKPMFILFLSVIASTLYTIFDKTLLGILSTKENVAYYEYSQKIIYIPLAVISTLSTLMLPRSCVCISNNDVNSINKYKQYSLHFTCFVSIGSILGLFGISDLLALLYYGESFAICGNVIITLTPIIYIIGIGGILRHLYIIPKSMDKWLVISYTINAIVNLILTFILIPKLGIYGAVIGTVTAETLGLIFQMILCKNFMSLKDVLKVTIPYLIFGVIMFATIICIKHFMNHNWFALILQVISGGLIYCIFSGIYLLLFSSIKRDIRKIIFKKS